MSCVHMTLGRFFTFSGLFLGVAMACGWSAQAGTGGAGNRQCGSVDGYVELADDSQHRTICAEIAAIDQMLVYNRFGSHNPSGMIFALTRDLVPVSGSTPGDNGTSPLNADFCRADIGVRPDPDMSELLPGKVRLRDCKRPRPLTLRANVGDIVHVRVHNLLRPNAPDYSRDFCEGARSRGPVSSAIRDAVSEGDYPRHGSGKQDHRALPPGDPSAANGLLEAACRGVPEVARDDNGMKKATDWPATRAVSFVIDGLRPLTPAGTGKVDDVCLGLASIPADGKAAVDCYWLAEREGPYFISSAAAPSGGEGDGGSLVHGLFGSLAVEPQLADADVAATQWYRSEVSLQAFDTVWQPASVTGDDSIIRHARDGELEYECHVRVDDLGRPVSGCVAPEHEDAQPVLNLVRKVDDNRFELVHNVLNAIIVPDANSSRRAAEGDEARHARDERDKVEDKWAAFREFTVVFHDELKTFYTRNFEELERFPQLAGVGDGFAINYGASGLGAMILANRKGIGPAADCMECLYEEFFLESWANGDPALLEWYADDPSNVHHSYINDKVVFRNYHAGPKETHVFHLHAHQWFAGNDGNRGTYLDSQTVAPRQGFTYNIYHGGLRREGGDSFQGWWDQVGSGNRNRTVGDSIFHCHLYPHFAQGMWALWRVHDVLEDGSRLLPDGQEKSGFSTGLLARNETGVLEPVVARPGSVDEKGGLLRLATIRDGRIAGNGPVPDPDSDYGTPVAGLIPMPTQPAPLLPTYSNETRQLVGLPGYPFFVAGEPGHRAPQPPLDMAMALDNDKKPKPGEWLDGGLPRHRVTAGSMREFGVSIPEEIEDNLDLTVAEGEKVPLVEDALYRLAAKMLAMGDFTGHLSEAKLKVLENDGTRLEKAAMAFHYNGQFPSKATDGTADTSPAISLVNVRGDKAPFEKGGYVSLWPNKALAPADFPEAPRFYVNGSAPKPGAPFADPCGVTETPHLKIDGGRTPGSPRSDPVTDPFYPVDTHFFADPDVIGFRRYEASAVQVDIVTNRAGWHDPQGRINVLTAASDGYKDAGPRAREEPFFFRAFSGECIEFRHTNELPKELELDDFQVKTPTDTIGQHIHLVKFDVTSADGSGNGFNYEDGTFAPDEIALRLCAAIDPASDRAVLPDHDNLGSLKGKDLTDQCQRDGEGRHWVPRGKALWAEKLKKNRHLFQTTVQRWFADPIMSETGAGQSDQADRTLRTVFTHDHFGPSSIQQHGFYSALVIEPSAMKVCPGTVSQPEQDCMKLAAWDGSGDPELPTHDQMVGTGTHKIVTYADAKRNPDGRELLPDYRELHPDYREFALAVADFALLYDPTDSSTDDLVAAAGPIGGGIDIEAPARDPMEGAPSPKGIATLVCEGEHRNASDNGTSATGDHPLEKNCDSTLGRQYGKIVETQDVPPAYVARDLILDPEVQELRKHFAVVRARAAYGEGLARPVNAPKRPESISVDHHDPYLVNYRGEPVPLRIGEKGDQSDNLVADTDRRPAGDDKPDIEPAAGKEPGTGQDDVRNEDATPVSPRADAGPYTLLPGVILASTESQQAQAGKRAMDCFYDSPVGKEIWKEFTRATNREKGEPAKEGEGEPAKARDFQPPGEAQEITPAKLKAIAEKKLDCSINAQSQDPRGDLAHVYRSELVGDMEGDTRLHGDPVTPLLETYSGERVQIRLIQGAQEVQHSFNIEGLQWRRNIDQRFPAGAIPLESVLEEETLWQKCRRLARDGRAREHDRWRSGKLELEDDVEFWTKHAERVALCDNLEGFTAAQEIGISEHFEISSAPSKHNSSYRMALGSNDEKTAALDYLYHFGSSDAVWNGAWGLMRVYEKETVEDLTLSVENRFARSLKREGAASSETVQMIDGRLKSLASSDKGTSGSKGFGADVGEALVECVGDEPRLSAFAVAMPLPDGQHYSSWDNDKHEFLRDPDALALIAIPWTLFHEYDSGSIDLAKLRKEALRYYRDEPMVIRGNAGDCMEFSIINALADPERKEPVNEWSKCRHQPNGASGAIRDCLGDAPMPKIVALNVEPDWKPDGKTSDGPVTRVQQNRIDVRPSSRLAMTMPVSMFTEGGDAILPFGLNRTISVPPGEIQKGSYYLGLLNLMPADDINTALASPQFWKRAWWTDFGRPGPCAYESGTVDLFEVPNLKISSLEFQVHPTIPQNEPIIIRALGRFVSIKIKDDVGSKVNVDIDQLRRGIQRCAPIALKDRSMALVKKGAVENAIVRMLCKENENKECIASLNPFNGSLVIDGKAYVVDIARSTEVDPVEEGVVRVDTADAGLGLVFMLKPQGDGETLTEAGLQKLTDNILEPAVAKMVAEADPIVSAIPYAFGAVPIKPVADLFNQLPHGLFGALVVEPQGAEYEHRLELANCENPGGGATGGGCFVHDPDHVEEIAELRSSQPGAHLGIGNTALLRVDDLVTGEEAPKKREIREFVLFYQDGGNHWDELSGNQWWPLGAKDMTGKSLPIVDNCRVCDDTYDFGEKAVSYRAAPIHALLWERGAGSSERRPELHDDMNREDIPGNIYRLRDDSSFNPLRLRARPGEEVVIRVIHPGGRARQRAFVTVGQDYDDLYPGFGFPHAALLAPGKAVTASLSAPVRAGCYMWSDGPRHIHGAGVWGLLDVPEPGEWSACD